MRILTIVSTCVILLVPSALLAQSAADRVAVVPVGGPRLVESIHDSTAAAVHDNARSGRWNRWSPMKKGAVVGLVAGTALGIVGVIAECEYGCGPRTLSEILVMGGVGAGVGVGIGALVGDTRGTAARPGGTMPVLTRAKSVSVSFRF